jgi:hypothetical protein
MIDEEKATLSEELLAVLRSSAKGMTLHSMTAVLALRAEIQLNTVLEQQLLAGDIEAEYTGQADGNPLDTDLYVFKAVDN